MAMAGIGVGAGSRAPCEGEYLERIFSESSQRLGDNKFANSIGAISVLLHNTSNMLGDTAALGSSVVSCGLTVTKKPVASCVSRPVSI
jgi:hypothetical protein